MRKCNAIVLMVSVPLALVGQSDYGFGKTESFVSTVKVVDSPIKSIGLKDTNISNILPDSDVVSSTVSANNSSLDVNVSEIPNVNANTLASETEVVLDLPGQSSDSATASMTAPSPSVTTETATSGVDNHINFESTAPVSTFSASNFSASVAAAVPVGAGNDDDIDPDL